MEKDKVENSGVSMTQETPLVTAESGKHSERKPEETTYSAADLAAAARSRFNVPPEVVQTALKVAGKDKATLKEAKQLVSAFMERKVTK